MGGNGVIRPAIPTFITRLDDPSIEVEFDSDEAAVEITLVESCGAVSGSVFIPIDQVLPLIERLRRALPK